MVRYISYKMVKPTPSKVRNSNPYQHTPYPKQARSPPRLFSFLAFTLYTIRLPLSSLPLLFLCSTVSRLASPYTFFAYTCGVFLHIYGVLWCISPHPRLYTLHLPPSTKIAIKHNRHIPPYNKKESVFKEICRNYLYMCIFCCTFAAKFPNM